MGLIEGISSRLEEPEPGSRTHERLVGLHAEVHPDGDSASFAIQFTNQPAFRVLVPITQAPAIMCEWHYASSLMLHRQQFKTDRGADKLLELCHTAKRPATVDVVVDPFTHDRLFLYQFDDSAPFTVRIPAMELTAVWGKLVAAIARSAN